MKTIKLFNTPKGWMARYENDPEIMALFGTDTIPTAYTEQASPIFVLAEIKKLNPDYNVKFNF